MCPSLLNYYLYHSFGPQFGLPFIFYLAVVATWVSMLLTAWVPYHPTKRGLQILHGKAAMAMACMMALIIASLTLARNVSTGIHIVAAILAVWYGFTIYLGFSLKRSSLAKRLLPHFIVIEVFNIVSFVGLVMGVAFWG
ncbi:MAG TPA: hypothetical protein VGS08_02405 [Candidatus Saccharimonadales bacterium]|nr:hypothetical protein [Candidatus Saccharimonadales bacterium]